MLSASLKGSEMMRRSANIDAPMQVTRRPKLAIASNNRGKIAEFQSLLGDEANIVSLDDLELDSPEETGTTFEENALLKAQFVFEQTGLPTLADDSGLEVDFLGGLPGVRSGRYAGEQHDDADNRALLLETLKGVPVEQRSARFVAVIAVIDHQGIASFTRGTCEGRIALKERGSGGFGYDSLFEFPDGRTMAELSSEEKNAISHRGNAIRLALPEIRAALGLNALRESQ
jgi:XTP/dITP diphosphohydrolase